MKILIAAGLFLLLQGAFFVMPAQAATANWQKGATIIPTTNTDFSSSAFQESVRNLKSTGANVVGLVVPFYQSNTYSTDVAPGWNTPTDAALGSAIDYAHSLGLSVTLKIHIDPYSNEWRAYINPSDRTAWFNNYGAAVLHTAQIAEDHHAEMIVVGTELVSMASSNLNSSNTQNWQTLIGRVRAAYSGKLTYGANSTNNNNDPFENEKASIGFWFSLDYAGLSAYYNLNTNDNSVQSLQSQWDYWNKSDLVGFAQRVGKPIIFTEVGYRSVDNAHSAPWDWRMGGGYNGTEQANDYDALMGYWDHYAYFAGVYWWDWQSNPNAGGSGDVSYTPQNKPAQQIMQKWFTNAVPPSNPPPNNTPPPQSGPVSTDIWWPSDGAKVAGLQPFKAMLQNVDVSNYQMYWQVDGGQLNLMNNNSQDWPHKESPVDLSGWHWQSTGLYTITFVSKNQSGSIISQRSVHIVVP